ncbi:MAG TPA: glycoside hydrolase family 2 TIM barrel-domain containing protein [Longimicrobiaceae bacterium]|nr:glycoside hydrolase family 2 TIM barrel-domain containing protein [Longimicrobiaceae bacterium]
MRRRDFVRTVAAAGAATFIDPASMDAHPLPSPGMKTRLDTGWRFIRDDVSGGERPGLDDAGWERVSLPHTARIEAVVTGEPGSTTHQWQGTCWYRRTLRVGEEAVGKKVFLHFEAAMNVAEVWLDGEPVGRHLGGWLPFVLDVTGRITPGRDAVLAVRLDNRDNPVTGPKPLHLLDFNPYHGLYRYVHLVIKDRLHITDPLLADEPGGGGVFVSYPRVSQGSATVQVRTEVRNDHREPRSFRVRTTLTGPDGAVLITAESPLLTLDEGTETAVVQWIEVPAARLWSPREPNLHTVRSEVLAVGYVTYVADVEETRVGIRRIEISRDGFKINGVKMFLRGTNRHQEYPYVGYAVPEDAQYRDARKIKEAGFDYVRLSHYPHSPAFMDACDELGLVVMDCIPGWQYFGADPAFAELQYRNCRDLLRRDRNHPCVILWEVSLNETAMPPEFIARTHAIAHREYLGDQCYTCGWTRGYDVFIQARQHGGCTAVADHPCVVSEYGDWEYYAMTAGLNQEAWQGLAPAESNSRQLRWQGERAMLQQAANFQEAHNDNQATAAFADGLWVMYDYNRGYAPDVESSGCMDLFRLPKYSYHFFRSQRSPHERLAGAASGPMVFIASEWTPASPADVRVFSNCDEVELRLNGRLVERRRPDRDRMSTRLAHPPFTFHPGRFTPGVLEALGFLGGRETVRHRVRTPGVVERLQLSVDLSGRAPARGRKDVLLCHAALQDAASTVVAGAWENVAFGATGDVRLVGANPFSSDAGIASILAQTEPDAAAAALYALCIVRGEGGVGVLGASASLTGPAEPFVIRYTTDGSVPGAESSLYAHPLTHAAGLRAALLVAGRVVATLDERTEKLRMRGSAPPEAREPFRHG